jgi:hypothetical protein
MTTDLARADDDRFISAPDREQAKTALAHFSATGDVSRMTDAQRAAYILWYCRTTGLTPGTGAVEIIEFYDPETKTKVAKVYPKAEAAKQLGNLHRIRIETISEEIIGNRYYKVTVRGTQPDGRCYDEVGYVPVTDREGKPLAGTRYTNALMKCHTVAKRRLVLGMIGLSEPPPDGTRLYLGPNAEILDAPTEEDRRLNDHPNEAAASGRPRFESLPGPATDLDDAPGLLPRPEDLEHPPTPKGPPASFKPSAEDVKRWLGAWFAAVKGTSLDDDSARHTFVRQWTHAYTPTRRTESLKDFFETATERQAGDLLAHVRAIVDDEKRALLDDLTNAAGEPEEGTC